MAWLNLEEELAEEFENFPKFLTFKELQACQVRGELYVSDEEIHASREAKLHAKRIAEYTALLQESPASEAIQAERDMRETARLKAANIKYRQGPSREKYLAKRRAAWAKRQAAKTNERMASESPESAAWRLSKARARKFQ